MKINKFLGFIAIVVLSFGCTQEDVLTDLDDSLTTKRGMIDDCFDGNCDGNEDGEGGGNTGGTTAEWSDYFYTHRGESNTNIYYAESNNGTSWSVSQLGLGAKSSKGPASTIFNNRRFIFYKGNSSPNIFFAYKSLSSNSWQGNTYINSVSKTSSSVSAAVLGGKVFVAYKGQSNPNLFLAYSTLGTNGNYTQVQALSVNDSISHFSIVVDGNTMYVFWTTRVFVNGDYRERLYYRTSTNPTNTNSWSSSVLLEDHLSSVAYEGGISAVSLNGNIHVTFGITYEIPPNGTNVRRLALGKLNQNQVWSKTIYTATSTSRAGIMATNDSNLLISYRTQYNGTIKTMKVNANGNIVTNPYSSGGGTNVGGINSYSKY